MYTLEGIRDELCLSLFFRVYRSSLRLLRSALVVRAVSKDSFPNLSTTAASVAAAAAAAAGIVPDNLTVCIKTSLLIHFWLPCMICTLNEAYR